MRIMNVNQFYFILGVEWKSCCFDKIVLLLYAFKHCEIFVQ